MPAIKVNWKEVFDGNKHILEENIHFKKATSFIKYVYLKAREYGVKIYPPKIITNINKGDKSIENVIIQVRKNEISVYKPTRTISDANHNIVDAEIVQNNIHHDIKKYDEYNEYPFAEWFAELVCGGQKTVEVNKLDEFDNPIPIIKEFEGGFQAITGKYVTENKVVQFNPRFVLELKYPQDFTCTPRRMAAIFCEAAKYTGVIDVNKLHFDYRKKDRLIIRAGHIAEAYFDRENTPDRYNLWENFNKNEKIPLPREKAEKWIDQLIKDGQLILWKGRDYSVGWTFVCALLRVHFPDIEFYGKEEVDSKKKDGTGWTNLILTIRKPMLERMPSGMTLEEWENSEEGKLIEQERDVLKRESEDNKLIESKGHLKLKFIKELKRLTNDANKIEPGEFKDIILSKIKNLKDQHIDVLGEEEVLRLESDYIIKQLPLESKQVIKEDIGWLEITEEITKEDVSEEDVSEEDGGIDNE